MSLPSKVKIVEVGPRDGLQNELQPVPLDIKVALDRPAVGNRAPGDRGRRVRVAQVGAADGGLSRGVPAHQAEAGTSPIPCWCRT